MSSHWASSDIESIVRLSADTFLLLECEMMEIPSIGKTDVGPLARYACDFCRQKKIRCSRELPKCAACRPWPGPCIYTPRANSAKRSSQAAAALEEARSESDDHRLAALEDRLERMEHAFEKLTEAVTKVLDQSQSTAPTPASSHQASEQQTSITTEDSSPSRSYLSAALSQASHDLTLVNSQVGSSVERENAASGLRGLSDAFSCMRFENEMDDVKPANNYYVPDRETGYALIHRYAYIAAMGTAIFSQPSDELLYQVVFQPKEVQQSAWIIFFNYSMLALATLEPGQANAVRAFRWNVNMALRDPKFFLEPSEVNIQALTLLATHGEDFATPNLSWMLMGYACQQAKAIGLPSAGVSSSFEHDSSWQRQLSLFWALFVIDKTCALAFGRPVFLEDASYRHVPIPDFKHLLKFSPHQSRGDQGQAVQPSTGSTFGAHVFLQNIELARLTDTICSISNHGGSDEDIDRMKASLESWISRTESVLSNARDAESASATEQQLAEMSLGMMHMRFQYLNILILLTSWSPRYADLRLDSSRQMISLLPRLVSNWNQVYNGVIWHLLYYPFTPFFIVFGHIIRQPSASTASSDLQLLTTTVNYFSNMRSQLGLLVNVSAKLHRTAEVFLQLAHQIVADATKAVPDTGLETFSSSSSTVAQASRPAPVSSAISAMLQSPQMDISMPDLMDALASGDADLESFLAWLPDQPSRGIGTTDAQDWSGESSTGPTTGEARQRNSFENTFDWFSWDAYYSREGQIGGNL